MAKKVRKIKVEKSLAESLIDPETTSNASDNGCQSPCLTTDIKFKLDEDAKLPCYAHDGDAGMDVWATDLEYDEDTDTYIYHTGVAYESGKNIVSLGFARSSNSKTDSYLTNGVGVIDCEIYRGKIQFRYKNRTALSDRIEMATLIEMTTIPWWKKMFMTENDLHVLYNTLYAKWNEYFMDHVFDFAPYEVGDKIGQIAFVNYIKVNSIVVDNLSETDRGVGGFGSTDKPKKIEEEN